MAEEIRVGRPFTPQSPTTRVDDGGAPKKSGSKLPWIILVIILIGLGVGGFLFRDKFMGRGDVKGAESSKSSGFQAVFLSNGQVYFGKIANASDMYVKLTDVYYLQVAQQQQQGTQTQTQTQQQQQQSPQISLVKLGNELHGPVDEMKINRDQVLFYEDMKDDAKVVQAIREYKANPNAANTPPANQNQAPQNTGSQLQGAQGSQQNTQTPSGQGSTNR